MSTPNDIPLEKLYRGYATTQRLKALQLEAAATLEKMQALLYTKALVAFFEHEATLRNAEQKERIGVFLDAFQKLPVLSFDEKLKWVDDIKNIKYPAAKFKYPGYNHDFFTTKAAHLRTSLTTFGERVQKEQERVLSEIASKAVADLPQTDSFSP